MSFKFKKNVKISLPVLTESSDILFYVRREKVKAALAIFVRNL